MRLEIEIRLTELDFIILESTIVTRVNHCRFNKINYSRARFRGPQVHAAINERIMQYAASDDSAHVRYITNFKRFIIAT